MNASPLFAIVLFALATPSGDAADIGRPQRELLCDAQDGVLDDFTLLEAVLVAGGCQQQGELEETVALFDRWAASVDAAALPAEPRAKAAELFARLHRE
ncbi:MAG: hypothetical protein KDA41_20595, partial [Planctomycetales bacterium]|nr:hypothetical protein [Planctomycetales bacterium]